MPHHTNPAEFMLDLVNADFSSVVSRGLAAKSEDPSEGPQQRLDRLHGAWQSSQSSKALLSSLHESQPSAKYAADRATSPTRNRRPRYSPSLLLALLHRSFIKSYRDVFVYGIRLIMYMGLAIMMGTVWLRLSPKQEDIQPLINAIFFGGAFMSFMAVAYVPAYLEDRAVFIKERANGLYGSTMFLIQNFLLGLPYLFVIAVFFSIVAYWLINLRPTAEAFFTWVMWLYLDLLAAEGLVVFMSSIFPNFVVSLALVAFANGLWMSVGGFLVSPTVLNVFWKYVFHYWDYQAYVFQGMMINEFGSRTYTCAPGCRCMYPTGDLQCAIPGESVLQAYGYRTGGAGKWVGIMIAIIAGYRVAGWIVLFLRKT